VTNNSAVGVIASVAGVNTPLNMSEVDLLNINEIQEIVENDEVKIVTGPKIELFEDGELTVTETELFTLAGNQGTNEGTFAFTGEATPVDASEESNPSFKLVLSFAPDVEED
jgi:radical SAM superfamily enzyme with C-terminal helix-hairpin-helix motif